MTNYTLSQPNSCHSYAAPSASNAFQLFLEYGGEEHHDEKWLPPGPCTHETNVYTRRDDLRQPPSRQEGHGELEQAESKACANVKSDKMITGTATQATSGSGYLRVLGSSQARKRDLQSVVVVTFSSLAPGCLRRTPREHVQNKAKYIRETQKTWYSHSCQTAYHILGASSLQKLYTPRPLNPSTPLTSRTATSQTQNILPPLHSTWKLRPKLPSTGKGILTRLLHPKSLAKGGRLPIRPVKDD